jgi:hypothetical protein
VDERAGRVSVDLSVGAGLLLIGFIALRWLLSWAYTMPPRRAALSVDLANLLVSIIIGSGVMLLLKAALEG